MSWLAKKLALLLSIIAIIVVLLTGVIANIWWLTVLKRMLAGGLIFMLIGFILGEYLNYNLNNKEFNLKQSENKQSMMKPEAVATTDDQSQASEMTPLDFEEIDGEQANVINDKLKQDELDEENIQKLVKEELGEELDSKKVADILKNMTEDN